MPHPAIVGGAFVFGIFAVVGAYYVIKGFHNTEPPHSSYSFINDGNDPKDPNKSDDKDGPSKGREKDEEEEEEVIKAYKEMNRQSERQNLRQRNANNRYSERNKKSDEYNKERKSDEKDDKASSGKEEKWKDGIDEEELANNKTGSSISKEEKMRKQEKLKMYLKLIEEQEKLFD